MLVNYIFRSKDSGGHSIEELFASVSSALPKEVEVNMVQLPYAGVSLKAMVLNIWHVIKLKGIIHITGDVHYIGLIPLKKTVLTIHDVNSIVKGSALKKIIFKTFWFTLPAFFVKKITVISQFSKQEVLQVIPWAKQKIKVIYNPVNPMFAATPKIFNPSNPTILHIGTKTNKNLENTIKALQDIPCTLVIVGALNTHYKTLLKTTGVTYVNYNNLSFDAIVKCYQNCDIVSFISLYEGFGLPIIEAQKTGRVVITSNKASIPEIAEDTVHYVNPLDVDAIQKGFEKIIADNNYREALINKGFKNVTRFNLDNITKHYLEVYKTVVNAN
ncbi:glycosyltransferase family 4 protein [Lacinutrix sp. MEBiC02595]